MTSRRDEHVLLHLRDICHSNVVAIATYQRTVETQSNHRLVIEFFWNLSWASSKKKNTSTSADVTDRVRRSVGEFSLYPH